MSAIKTFNKHLGRLVLFCNILVLLWLYGCCALTWIPADEHPLLSLATISFPVPLILNFCFIIVWLIVNYKRIWIPVLGMFLCWGYVMDYCPVHLGGSPNGEGLKVVSWNTKNMGGSEYYDSYKDNLKKLDADIVCLQETNMDGSSWDDFLSEMKDLGYEYHSRHGQVLFTRLHILESDTIVFATRSNRSQWYLLEDANQDTIMLVNNHLESNRLSSELKDEYRDVIKNPEIDKAKESGHAIVPLLREAASYRGNQTKAIRDFVKQHQNNPVIVCGDFNDTPISYTYQTLARELKNTFRESGNGIGVSYNEKGFWVRIDHIFCSEEVESSRTFIDRSIDISDHFPIVSWVNFNQNQQ